MKKIQKRKSLSFFILIFLLCILFFIAINLGSIQIRFVELFKGLFIEFDENVATIYDLRFPRILIAILGGGALAVSGVLLQAVMKNPLADPGIIGISSGASMVSILLIAFFPSLYFFTPLFALLGGLISYILVYSLSWKSGLNPLRIVLVGVAVNAVFIGMIDAFQTMTGGFLSGAASIVNANISMKTWDDVKVLFIYVCIGMILALIVSGSCNLLTLEDKTARSLGVDVDKTRLLISFIAVMLASISTAIVGVIGFLGLIAPHIGRILVGSDHKLLIPYCAILGAFILLLADTLGRVIAVPYEISPSVIMAVVGGPCFIFLLKRGDKTHES
ncbi:iron chelate uptake ABC transporter family permease subunit [Alkalibaculum sp. M08DMB]|uniref:Probable heme-iron transport system permease protein IsdF n=1 Tax=Alkalibaculum sporogenes TaxID=2655001 RepID=A0A6A7K484_9FIRM|nr:iron ABC transporter permease [Alkalibaculum sporogenes]MPW24262.1 iron chelate uptake ABC transporter family permease subunit [Alkalibaculum sporogenes]